MRIGQAGRQLLTLALVGAFAGLGAATSAPRDATENESTPAPSGAPEAVSRSAPPASPAQPSVPSESALSPPDVPPPEMGPPTAPAGSPVCPRADGTGASLATSRFVSTLDAAAARAELDAWNDICPDGACEGSFDWLAYDLRSDAHRSEITYRVYTSPAVTPIADVTDVVVEGPHHTGRVLAQHTARRCSSPCAGGPTFEPCLALDIRCELASPFQPPERNDFEWSRREIACHIALEHAIRDRIPEFAPRE